MRPEQEERCHRAAREIVNRLMIGGGVDYTNSDPMGWDTPYDIDCRDKHDEGLDRGTLDLGYAPTLLKLLLSKRSGVGKIVMEFDQFPMKFELHPDRTTWYRKIGTATVRAEDDDGLNIDCQNIVIDDVDKGNAVHLGLVMALRSFLAENNIGHPRGEMDAAEWFEVSEVMNKENTPADGQLCQLIDESGNEVLEPAKWEQEESGWWNYPDNHKPKASGGKIVKWRPLGG